mmetsp:Transcript_15566/g.33960  ORF Transcript_15566/g.33960 Transcript_15566/m.33960 type:complete len:589 (+) Transcript_15566:137-1903(+)
MTRRTNAHRHQGPGLVLLAIVSSTVVFLDQLDQCQAFSMMSLSSSSTSLRQRPPTTTTTTRRPRRISLFSTNQDESQGTTASSASEAPSSSVDPQQQQQLTPSSKTSSSPTQLESTSTIRQRVGKLARQIVVRPISQAYSMPKAVAEVLKDATISAVDLAVEEVFASRNSNRKKAATASIEPIGATARLQERLDQIRTNRDATRKMSQSDKTDAIVFDSDIDINAIVDEAFAPMEQSLNELEQALEQARKSHNLAKSQALQAMEAIQAAATAQAEAAITAVSRAEQVAERVALVDFYAQTNFVPEQEEDAIIRSLADVDFATSEMAPPFLDESSCLVPGEPVVRVEKAPENSRRIFAGIDIMADLEHVWNVLTDYENLEKVVPNLLVNDVLQLHDGVPLEQVHVDRSKAENEQCQELAQQMKGAELRQVGGAKVVGINFSARTTLEVREWPQGLPDFAHFQDDVWEGKSRKERAKDYTQVPLERYQFPRPFAVSKLHTRDITMQSMQDDDGEFRMYQGVWRMQPLPGCAQNGEDAMRLTYAVEVSPRAYLPVQLIEGRIVKDLCNNLKAIRDYVEVHIAKSREEAASV